VLFRSVAVSLPDVFASAVVVAGEHYSEGIPALRRRLEQGFDCGSVSPDRLLPYLEEYLGQELEREYGSPCTVGVAGRGDCFVVSADCGGETHVWELPRDNLQRSVRIICTSLLSPLPGYWHSGDVSAGVQNFFICGTDTPLEREYFMRRVAREVAAAVAREVLRDDSDT